MQEATPTPGARVVSTVAAAGGWVVSVALAIFVIAVAEDVSLWVRAGSVLAAAFFTWLLWFAPTKVRVAVVRWFPWC